MSTDPNTATRLLVEAGRPTAVVHQRCRLEVTKGPDRGRSVDVDRGRIRIGTGPANDLVLSDRAVSRLHAQIDLGEDGYRVRDLGSTNGTRIGGLRVVDAFLEPGARLRLGTTEVRFDAIGEGLAQPLDDANRFGRLTGDSVAMRALFAQLRRVAPTDATVLLVGESGTGKDLAAEAIVQASPRQQAPFVVVDCGSLVPTLIEAELFGHELGAFTGATVAREGAFERADGGTLFLDEIGELPLELQPRLLRALESREVRRLGASQPITVDVRVIAATNRPLAAEVNRGAFRADLYYRLAVVELTMPSLRTRLDDLPLLVAAILEDLGRPPDDLRPETVAELARYPWPGNVRELRNFLERALALEEVMDDPFAAPEALGQPADAPARPVDLSVSYRVAKERASADFERAYVAAALAAAGGNVSQAARQARMDRMFLYKLAQRYGLLQRHRTRK